MWVNHRNGGRRGDHGFYRAAAFAQHGNRALAGQMVRATAIPWADTLLCMGCPHDPKVMSALQKLFHFERKVSFVGRGGPFLKLACIMKALSSCIV